MHIKLIASVPHTGTQTLVSLSEGTVLEIGVLFKSKTMLAREVSPGAFERGLCFTGNVLWGHFIPQHMKFIQVLAIQSEFYIPLRDPLASLCTTIHNDQSHGPIHLESWRLLAECIYPVQALYNPTFIPMTDDLPVVNSKGDYYLKQAYEAQDKAVLGRLPEWTELCHMEPLLRPMLEEYGYKDLLWWS